MDPIPRRYEHFDGLTEKFRPRIAEDPLGLGIDHDDGSRPVNHHHRARRSLDDQLEPPLGGNRLFRVVTLIGARAATDRIVARAIAGVNGLLGVVLSVVGVHSPPRRNLRPSPASTKPCASRQRGSRARVLSLAALPFMACCTLAGAWLTPASVRLHMCGTGAAYRQNVREFNPPCEIGTAKNRSRSRYRLHGLGLCAPALHWHLMSRGGGMTKGAQTADRDQTDKPWPWPALFQWLRPAAFDPDQGRGPNHPVKLNHHMEQEVRRAAMPVSPYLRSPARTLREACHEVNRDNQADCVPIVRWPISVNGNTAENSMQRLS